MEEGEREEGERGLKEGSGPTRGRNHSHHHAYCTCKTAFLDHNDN